MLSKYLVPTAHARIPIPPLIKLLIPVRDRTYIQESISRAKNAGRGRWPECALGRAHTHLAHIMKARMARDELVRPIEDFGNAILEKYRHVSQSYTPSTEEPMVLYDLLQPVFDGRYTGRGLVPLLQKMVADGHRQATYNRTN